MHVPFILAVLLSLVSAMQATAQTSVRPPRTFHTTASFVQAVRCNANGSQVLTAGGDGRAILWDAVAGTTIRTFDGHRGPVYGVAFDAMHPVVVTGGYDSTVRLWDRNTAALQRTLVGHQGHVHCVDVHPNGTMIASGGSDGLIVLWNATTGAVERMLRGHTLSVTTVRFSTDGTRLLSCGTDGTTRMWDVRTGALQHIVLSAEHPGRSYAAAAADEMLATTSSGAENVALLWNAAAQPTPSVTLSGHRDAITSVAFVPGTHVIATASADKTVRLWDVLQGRAMATIADHQNVVTSVDCSADGSTLVSADLDGTIVARDVAQVLVQDMRRTEPLRVDPNPSRDLVTISFVLPTEGRAEVSITDVGGRRLATPLQGTTLSAGQHSVRFDASAFTDGLYVVVLSTPSGTTMSNMHVIR